MAKLVALLPIVLFAAGCSRTPSDQLARLSDEFVHTTLAFSPAMATSVGLHQHEGQNLDNLLDDMSPANLDRQRHYYEHFRERLDALNTNRLTAEDQADLSILQDQVSLALLDLNELHSHLHNPTLYVETLGNALFSPYVLEYAPPAARMRNIIARLQKAPFFLDQASTNLSSSPGIWTKVAMEENEGNIGLVDKTIRAAVPPDLRDTYNLAALSALDAMRKFQEYLKNGLSNRDDYDWRMTSDRYMRKFRYTLESGVEADTMLQMAERELVRVRAEMLELALPLHRQLAPAHKDHTELSGAARENQVIGEVLAKIAERHSTRESYMDDARQDLAEARAFVEQKHLLTLPQRANLQVIPTPEFMRDASTAGESPGDSHARVHARRLFRRRFFGRAGARTAVGRFLLGHAHSRRLAQGARRIQTARVQLLQAQAAHHPRSHARPLRADGDRQQCAAREPARAAVGARQRPVHRGLGRVRHPDDAR